MGYRHATEVPLGEFTGLRLDLLSANLAVMGSVAEVLMPTLCLDGDRRRLSIVRAGGQLILSERDSQPEAIDTKPLQGALMLPGDYRLAHLLVKNEGGNVQLKSIYALGAVVASWSGSIEVDGMIANSPKFASYSGGVNLTNLHSKDPVDVRTGSGDITVTGGRAEEWLLKSALGKIEARGVIGEVRKERLARSLG